eukprot:TRINITY_DN21265_c0_g1_i1.p1 TRINITY_DN21265_c0_g1~~TRINITY_DN21265_c0_g1_i1.p1  ORF type:complete len:386 (+),score=193.88 TRINITY_DN21265_c0_g1_i1:53-1210(+)
MFNSESAIYGLKYQARCIAANSGELEEHEFWVGTLNVGGDNELHLTRFDESDNKIEAVSVFAHDDEIWSITPCSVSSEHLITVHSNAKDKRQRATLWRAPAAQQDKTEDDAGDVGDDHKSGTLERIVELGGHNGRVRSVTWKPSDGGNAESQSSDAWSVVTLDDSTVRLWDLGVSGADAVEDSTKCASSEPLELGRRQAFTAGSWDPHHTNQFVTVNGTSIRGWDLRTMKTTQHVERAHLDTIRDVDYNPNKPYHVVTCSDDRLVKFWDLRKASAPLKSLSRHSHWVWTTKYNRFHDQLVLSAGTDTSVTLWSIVSISSAPLGDLEDPANEKEGDKMITTYDEHEDSVYSIAWSVCDAWIFASLSYDGRVVVNHVPAAEKYKILL